MENTRIILLAHGKKGYAYAAFNLAMSIKHHGCTIPIHLFAQRETFEGVPMIFFNHVTWIDSSFYNDQHGQVDISLSKINIVRDLPDTHNIYLDVDAMAVKDITPFIEHIVKLGKPYLTDVVGKGTKGQEIPYDVWAKHDYAWPFFGLEQNSTWYAIQSSWAYFHKDAKLDFYPALKYYHEKKYPLSELKEKWATGQLPDELLFSGVCAHMEYDPSCDIKPIFFGTHHISNLGEIKNNHYLLSMFGNGASTGGRTLTKPIYQEYYSREISNIARANNVQGYKKEYVMRDKIINNVR